MIESNFPVSVLIVDDNPAKLTALAEITQQRGGTMTRKWWMRA